MSREFIIGGISGVVSRTLTAPLELYKLQRQNAFMPGGTVRAVFREEGIRYLWKGNLTNCVRVFPQNAVNFCVYSWCDESVLRRIEDRTTRRFFSGAVGGAVSMILVYPLDTIRTRLSLQRHANHYTGLCDAISRISRNDLFKGLRMSILGYAPFSAISFSSYFSYRDFLDAMNPVSRSYNTIMAGGPSGLTAIAVTYPTDLIRKRLQLQNFDKNVPRYSGIVDCAQKIITTQGVRGLYMGLFATCIKLFPTVGIQFFVLENLR